MKTILISFAILFGSVSFAVTCPSVDKAIANAKNGTIEFDSPYSLGPSISVAYAMVCNLDQYSANKIFCPARIELWTAINLLATDYFNVGETDRTIVDSSKATLEATKAACAKLN